MSSDAKYRIKTMVQTQDGFEIANADLKLRALEILWGLVKVDFKFKIGDLSKDSKILQFARKTAKEILTVDPDLSSGFKPSSKKEYLRAHHNKIQWSDIS